MNILVFSFGMLLLGISMAHCKSVKVTLSTFRQWCISSADFMDVIAVLMVLVVILVNWMGY